MFLCSKRFNSRSIDPALGDTNVLRMLWTRLLGGALSSRPCESKDTLVRNPYGVGSPDGKMVLYVLLELLRVILGLDKPVTGLFHCSTERVEPSLGYSSKRDAVT